MCVRNILIKFMKRRFSTLFLGYDFVICCVKSQMQNWSFKMYLCLSASVSPKNGYPNGLLNVAMISVMRYPSFIRLLDCTCW